MDQGAEPALTPALPTTRPVVRWLTYVYVLAQGVIITFIVGALIHTFVATPFRISGVSMDPNFFDGQFLLVDKLSYLIGQPKRGDVVVLKFPANPSQKLFIKRIVGLPGETVRIQGGALFVDEVKLTEAYLPEVTITAPDSVMVLGYQEYYVMGDNRPNSNDSRYWGPLPKEDIVGLSRLSLSPTYFGWIAQPAF